MTQQTKQLRVTREVHLPLDAVTQTFGFIGRKGSGKTYGSGVMVETMLGMGAQVVILDPLGIWYGLRLNSRGTGPGFDIPILGGQHADIPLESGSGEIVANMIVDYQIPAVIDISEFRKNQRKEFVTHFAEQLFHRKKTSRSPMHLVLEEAQVFAPQRIGKGEERMLGAIEDLVRLGRNFGIGDTLISQRPQSINKEVLNQVEALFVFQLSGPHERKAINSWVIDKDINVSDMVDSLPSLSIGQAYLWSPQWLGVLRKVHLRKKKTFDSSSTPTVGQNAISPKQLTAIEMDELRTAMKETAEKIKADDPKELKREIVALKKQLATAQQNKEVERIEVPVFQDNHIEALHDVLSKTEDIVRLFGQHVADLHTMAMAAKTKSQPPKLPVREARAAPRQAGKTANTDINLRSGAVRILKELAARYPAGYSKPQVGVLTKFKHTGGTFNTYMSDLRRAEYIVQQGDLIFATEKGIQALGGDIPEAPKTHEEVMEQWRSALRSGAYRILEVIVNQHPIAKPDIGSEVGMVESGGTFNTYMSDLRRNGLIYEQDGFYYPNEILYP